MSERLDCGDNSCASPERERGGMRTNGGCCCEKEEIARAYERMADRIRAAPSYRRRGEYPTADEARQQERARIVAWLRHGSDGVAGEGLREIADDIERGEHER